MAAKLVDLVKITINSTGAGAFELGAAVEGYRGIEVLTNGEQYSYSIVQGANFEIGRGVYLASGSQMTRAVIASSNGGAPIDLAPNAQIAFVALAADLTTPSFLYPLSGADMPDESIGAIGQFYFQTGSPFSMYGPKTPLGWGVGTPLIGNPGPASAFRADLNAIKVADVADGVSFFSGAQFTWTDGDFTGQADDANVIASNSAPIGTGAWVRQGADQIWQVPEGAGAKPANVRDSIRDLGLNLKQFGVAVGTGSSAVDTAAWQAAFNALAATGRRKLIVPFAEYLIEDTILPPAGLNCIEIIGEGGYDGVRGPLNFGLFTSIKWVGDDDATKAVVKFDQASGVVWRSISINCDYKAGYGLQFMSSAIDSGGVKNFVERCSIHYAKRDGILVGEWGDPAADPGDRQFFGNRFTDLTFYGCHQSAIHINEWNADQQFFDSVMVYLDDNPVVADRIDTLNAFWFDSGGQHSILQNCQAGGMTVVSGVPSSGFMIRNQKSDGSNGGAFGLDVTNCWQEGDGGLYYGVTSTNDHKAFKFERCASFTNNPANRSVYIDKGTSAQIPYTFDTCTFLSDIEIASDTFEKQSLALTNCIFETGKGVIDSAGNLTLDGTFTKTTVASNQIVVPRFVDLMKQTLTTNANAVFANGVSRRGDQLTLIITQDGTGGRTINFATSGNFSSQPPIPHPSLAANATTVYDFVSDGAKYYLTGARGAQGSAIPDASGGSTIDAEARTALNALLAVARARGDIA